MNSLSIARRGKGFRGLVSRTSTISRRYGLTAHKMDRLLGRFADILDSFNCGATFPITCAALARNRAVIEKYLGRGLEFAVHGYVHVDHSELSYERQKADLERSLAVFKAIGLKCSGFRAPYLRTNQETLRAVRESGFLYESSQAISWKVRGVHETERYRIGLDFYGAVDSEIILPIPRLEDGLVRIPYCVPDDESLIERLAFSSGNSVSEPWLSILSATYQNGQLFTLGLHPERILECEGPLRAVLSAARSYSPHVWIARLDEIADWWKQRLETKIRVSLVSEQEFRVTVDGPQGVCLIVQGGEILTASARWHEQERIIEGNEVHLRAPLRPFIAVSPDSSPAVSHFLGQQGYIVETADGPGNHSLFIRKPGFERAEESELLRQIQAAGGPLVRLGRWPDGAGSALCITGDIDAITVWDYALRMLGR